MNTQRELETVRQIINQLEQQHTQLVALINTLTADGYPTNNGQGPRGKNHVSDPTANAALKHDQAAQDRQRFRTLIIRLRDIAIELDRLRAKYLDQPASHQQH